MTSLKNKFPFLTVSYLKSDNAGCYHCGPLLAYIQARNLNTSNNIQVLEYNFSEAQAGKDLCDSKTSHCKMHMLRYADEGHDITCPLDMKVALESYGGVRGTYSSVISIEQSQEPKVSVKIPGISQLNNFQFSSTGISGRKAFMVGKGRMICNESLCIPQLAGLTGIQVQNLCSYRFYLLFKPRHWPNGLL